MLRSSLQQIGVRRVWYPKGCMMVTKTSWLYFLFCLILLKSPQMLNCGLLFFNGISMCQMPDLHFYHSLKINRPNFIENSSGSSSSLTLTRPEYPLKKLELWLII